MRSASVLLAVALCGVMVAEGVLMLEPLFNISQRITAHPDAHHQPPQFASLVLIVCILAEVIVGIAAAVPLCLVIAKIVHVDQKQLEYRSRAGRMADTLKLSSFSLAMAALLVICEIVTLFAFHDMFRTCLMRDDWKQWLSTLNLAVFVPLDLVTLFGFALLFLGSLVVSLGEKLDRLKGFTTLSSVFAATVGVRLLLQCSAVLVVLNDDICGAVLDFKRAALIQGAFVIAALATELVNRFSLS